MALSSYINTFKITNNAAPGIPSIPTIIAFSMLSPIWKLKELPIKFIIKINSIPRQELTISFIAILKGMIKLFPNIKIIATQATNVKIIFVSICTTFLNIIYVVQ